MDCLDNWALTFLGTVMIIGSHFLSWSLKNLQRRNKGKVALSETGGQVTGLIIHSYVLCLPITSSDASCGAGRIQRSHVTEEKIEAESSYARERRIGDTNRGLCIMVTVKFQLPGGKSTVGKWLTPPTMNRLWENYQVRRQLPRQKTMDTHVSESTYDLDATSSANVKWLNIRKCK